MVEFRYHRMTQNDFGWKHPHTGRLGIGSGYVSDQGFGHEDWNFARDVWDDDRYHLYLRMKAKRDDLDKVFNIVLGVHTKAGPMIVGFAENVKYSESNLADRIWKRRAQEVKALQEGGQLGAFYSGMSVEEIKADLISQREIYNVSVAPTDLHILEQPSLIPSSVYIVKTPQYRLFSMTAKEYSALIKADSSTAIKNSVDIDDDTSFPEGAQVERLHKYRERNRRLVNLAKKAFMERHGALHCEACDMEPSKLFKSASLAGKVIEAHHNVKLSDSLHSGKTRIEDLSMLCPSCHRAIHTIRPWLSVEKLRKRLKS